MSFPTTHQHTLAELYPGSPGGRALLQIRGREYFRAIGSRGGATTRDRYGRDHLVTLASAGGREKRRRQYSWPATIRPWYGGVERRVPWWPHQPRRRRRQRPVFVRIEVQP